jgi:hypothetical protein
MNKILYNLFFFCIFFIAVDVYFWQAYKSNFLFSVKLIPILKWIYWLFSILAIALLIYSMSNYQNTDAPKYLIVVRAFVISFYLAKIIACFPLLIDDLLSDDDDFALPKCAFGLYIPADEILSRINLQWFARLSPQQVLESNTVIARYLLLCN